MLEGLVCWKCGARLDDVPQPLSRRAECPACRAELHVCRLCRHYDPAKARQCREPLAEAVKDKTRANFCDWFQPRPGAYAAPAPSAGARAELNALFGGDASVPGEPDATRRALDDLFGGNKD